MRKTGGHLIPVERIEDSIIELRGQKVILDADLAILYKVTTKRLNEQVRRNAARFPADFMFQLTDDEYSALRSQFATSNTSSNLRSQNAALKPGRGGRRYLPHAFTEHGAVMVATVLNSQRPVEISVFAVRAFIRMRRMLSDHRQFALKLAELERKLASHDTQFKAVFDAIRQLMRPSPPKKPAKIGF